MILIKIVRCLKWCAARLKRLASVVPRVYINDFPNVFLRFDFCGFVGDFKVVLQKQQVLNTLRTRWKKVKRIATILRRKVHLSIY